ncbi:c-type cytochrome [candidate division KSB1 bacterium]|nr:c-type cytochrome [candidate division KSB1 bacterium]
MEWPIFQMPYIGNRLLVAIIGVIHICISHGMAVGGSFFVVLLHYKSIRENDMRLNELAHKVLKIFFIITTSFGALTGVGIWLVTATVSPATIGSLLHVFFWVWFTEWVVFVTEVILILLYYLAWSKLGPQKGLRVGVVYVVASWLTMMLITGILGAMLTPGKWLASRSLLDGFFNPTYLPQLFTRTFLAALLSYGFGLLIVRFHTAYRDQWETVWQFAGKGFLILSPIFLFAVLNYYYALPQQIEHLIATALMTMKYATYAQLSKIIFLAIVLLLMLVGFILLKKRKDYVILSIVPIVLLVLATSNFERVREFIRKPYTIYQYLYANSIKEDEAPFLNQSGILPYSGWAARSSVEVDPELRNGEMLFKMECGICHTYTGINGITKKTSILQDKDIIDNFLKTYKRSHPFMPPFVGTEEERKALAAYLDKIVNGSQNTKVDK